MRIQSILAALGCAAVASTAQAGVALDQASIPETGAIPWLGAASSISPDASAFGQSFTAGATGRLARVDLLILDTMYAEAAGGFTIWLEDNGGAQLFSTHVAFSEAPEHDLDGDFADILKIDRAGAGVQVAAGATYKMLISADAGSQPFGPAWFYELNDVRFSYGGGESLVRTIWGDLPTSGRIDYGFRTYVDTAVPEPGTWALMLAGFGGVGAALRRRRAVAA